MNEILDKILPYKKRYFSFSSFKEKVTSFLRSVIYINYENCMSYIHNGKKILNTACYNETQNILSKGSLMINNKKLYDYFEEKCFYRSKTIKEEDCKHKGFFVASDKKEILYSYLEDKLQFSKDTINEIDKYINPKRIKFIQKIKSSIIPDDAINYWKTLGTRNTTTRKNKKQRTSFSEIEEDEDEEDESKDDILRLSPKNKTTRKNTKQRTSFSEIEEDEDESKDDTLHLSPRNTTTRKHTSKRNTLSEDEEILQKVSRFEQNRASRIITSKLRENPKSILTFKLKKICKDSGYCIAFGKNTELIKKAFDNFSNPEFIKSITTLSSGDNGEVLEVLFKRYQYKAYTILKMMKNNNKIVDNLVYEYIVGKFLINKYYKKFPCFLETYGFIFNDRIQDIKYNKELFDTQNIDITQIKSLLKHGCTNEKNFGLVIEYVKNPNTLLEKLDKKKFWYKNLLIVLFQVYYTLFLLKDAFTHYDLHLNNVLVFEPKKKHYIHYHYHYKGEVISFKSNYIVKIIDYGRCGFVNNEDNIKSLDIYKTLCSIPECKQENSRPCGARKGFIISAPANKNYFTLTKLNNSHDLRLLKSVGYLFNNKFDERATYTRQFNKIDREKIYLLFNGVKYLENFGTPQDRRTGLVRDLSRSQIYNISDAFVILKELVQLSYFIAQNDKFYVDKKKLGDLNIYDDGKDMVFTEI